MEGGSHHLLCPTIPPPIGEGGTVVGYWGYLETLRNLDNLWFCGGQKATYQGKLVGKLLIYLRKCSIHEFFEHFFAYENCPSVNTDPGES